MKEFIKTLKTSTTALLMLSIIFLVVEPAMSNASVSASSQFTETLSVTSEISFLVSGSNLTLSPSIGGITGGTANGQTSVRVLTNNATGYSMTLTASSSLGMIGISGASVIPAYVPASGTTPDFTFTTPVNTGRFGYTVEASTTADMASIFKDNGATCGGAGAADAADSCWLNASTTATTIVNRSTATAASGATTTIKFRAVITANPVPAISQDTYVATTTLTATTN